MRCDGRPKRPRKIKLAARRIGLTEGAIGEQQRDRSGAKGGSYLFGCFTASVPGVRANPNAPVRFESK